MVVGNSTRPRFEVALIVLLALLAEGCSSQETYPAHGVVVEVLPTAQQVIIAHDDIVGLMPAMTMNMSVANPELLDELSPGDLIDFEITVTSGRGKITAIEVVGRRPVPAEAVRASNTLGREDPAPAFDLIDHASNRVRLQDLAGKTLLLDFIFTRCTGPCPILTSRNVAVERLLSDSLRQQTHFVSISIDPERDTPEDLANYGRARGADLEHWSFLTGEPATVAQLVSDFGVGTSRSSEADGELQHIIVSFLIDPDGQIVKRYLGNDTAPEVIEAALEEIAAAAIPQER